MKAGVSRRGFLKASAAAGVGIKGSFLASPARTRLIEMPPLPGPHWLKTDGRPKYRLDAIAKVTGAKTFSRDYRARDLDGWPQQQAHAFPIHATKADQTYDGIDLSALGEELKPYRLVLHEDLVRDGITIPVPGFYGDVFLVPTGEVPRLLAEPVALLIYQAAEKGFEEVSVRNIDSNPRSMAQEGFNRVPIWIRMLRTINISLSFSTACYWDFARYDAAKRHSRFDDRIVRYGKKSSYSHPQH